MPDWSLYSTYYFTDEENGDIVNDTIYERTVKVEEEINIDIGYSREVYINETNDLFKSLVLAGDDVYELFFTHSTTGLKSYISEHYVHDWNTIPNIDMEKPYWDQSARECMSVDGILPLASSKLIIPDINSLLYNKEMYEDYSLEPLYPIIANGSWTWDRLIEMAEIVTSDLNGDSVMDENDRYGYIGEFGWQFGSITTSCDQYIVEKDDSGVHTLAINTEKMVNIVEKMYGLFEESNIAFTWTYSKETDPNSGGKPPVSFDEGRGLFYMIPLSSINNVRSAELDFGIIPLPKYDEAQENYRSLNWAGFMTVPITAKNTEMIGITVELLSYYNEKLVMPVFYDVLLGQKLARDEESIRMLDIIFDNSVYDLGVNLTLYTFLNRAITAGGEFASYYASNESSSIAMVEGYVNAFKAYEE